MKHEVKNKPFTVFTVQINTALDPVTGINVNTLEKINKYLINIFLIIIQFR
jgi:hypothetical protein